MTVSKEVEGEIARLGTVEGWKPGTIATQLGLHHEVVDRVLETVPASPAPRPSKTDPYVPLIREKLQKYPRLPATVLWQMATDRGYEGCVQHFRRVVAKYRPHPPAEAYLRLRTLPAEEGQVDWAHFGQILIGGAIRFLMAFVMVLSWSRELFVRFFLNARLENFLRGHEQAFVRFNGVPRRIKYDNLRSAVLERRGDAIRYHPGFLDFVRHYRYEPRPVAVARGNEKGRVERAIRYVRESFFTGRAWKDLDDLNRQADEWCLSVAGARRCPEDTSMSVHEAFLKEQPRLLDLPGNPYPTDERVPVTARKTPYVRFDGNDYSVPHTHVGRPLVVIASLDTVRVLDGIEVVASHARSFGKKGQIEDPAHIAGLVAHKARARKERAMDRLHHAVPRTDELFVRLAERGDSLGAATTALTRLLDEYGTAALDAAVQEALAKGAPHPNSVRCILERKRHQAGQPVPIPVALSDDVRARDVVVRPHALSTYDALKEATNDAVTETGDTEA